MPSLETSRVLERGGAAWGPGPLVSARLSGELPPRPRSWWPLFCGGLCGHGRGRLSCTATRASWRLPGTWGPSSRCSRDAVRLLRLFSNQGLAPPVGKCPSVPNQVQDRLLNSGEDNSLRFVCVTLGRLMVLLSGNVRGALSRCSPRPRGGSSTCFPFPVLFQGTLVQMLMRTVTALLPAPQYQAGPVEMGSYK